MLTGVRPFGGDNAASMMYQIIHTEATPPSQRRPGLDAALEAICLKAMARKPADRYADGEAMAAALRAWAPTAALPAKPVATQPPIGLPTAIWQGVAATVNAPPSLTIQPAPASSTFQRNRNPLRTVVVHRFGLKGKAWAYVSAAVLALLIVATMLFYFLRPSGEAARMAGPVNSSPTPVKEELPDQIVNAFGMRLKLIKPGAFKMGSPDWDKAAAPDEKPQHDVKITRPFYLAVNLVTKGQFATFVRDADYKTTAEQAGAKNTWSDPGFEQTYDDPVVFISWMDALKFCEWLSQKEKKTYGLPTEAEWEYSCRAGTTTTYSFGDDPKRLDDFAWYGDNSDSRTHPVGDKKPNPWGLYDMHGNVVQWCMDLYDADYYQKSPIQDPQNSAGIGLRVLRGGCWGYRAERCRTASRSRFRQGPSPRSLGAAGLAARGLIYILPGESTHAFPFLNGRPCYLRRRRAVQSD